MKKEDIKNYCRKIDKICEAAEILNVSRYTIYRLLNKGQIDSGDKDWGRYQDIY